MRIITHKQHFGNKLRLLLQLTTFIFVSVYCLFTRCLPFLATSMYLWISVSKRIILIIKSRRKRRARICRVSRENYLKSIVVCSELFYYYTLYSLSAFWLAKSPLLILRIHVILWTSMIISNYICSYYTVRSTHCAPLPKEREHLNGFEWCGRLVRLSLYFYKHN